ncbi:MAG: hypothetical protein Q9169_003144 [Polycauliona sp. 2 TL-2023]
MTLDIEDIRRDQVGISLLHEIGTALREKRLPTLLLYDERGLKLFEDITYLDEYYLTNAEIDVLKSHATEIAALIPDESDILELGSGNLRKVKILLDALELAEKRVNYYALDLSKPELQRTLSAVPAGYKFVQCHGLLATYDDGLRWMKRPEKQGRRPTWILSLGSSIGNFGREEAKLFLQDFANTLRRHDDRILVGLDACQDKHKVFNAYNDRHGKTHEFVQNGLLHANRLMNQPIFKLDDWHVIGEYDETEGRHQAFYSAVRDVVIEGVGFEAGDRIRVEESYKWSSEQSRELWQAAGLVHQASFGNSSNDYHLHLLARPSLAFPQRAEQYATKPLPNLEDFTALWAAWDTIISMIGEDELLSQPIRLRNCCIFYVGHIPAFLDIHLTRATGLGATEPKYYQTIFERGVDPDVDDPELCHAHSEIPDSWPPLNEILDYQTRVRSRVKDLLSERDDSIHKAHVRRALWLGFEHEAMHLETLLYMILQSDKALPPPGPVPDFEAIGQNAQQTAVDNDWIKVPASTIHVGMNDPEDNDGSIGYFAWDIEKPARKKTVPAFEAKARPLTNEDFAHYLEESNQSSIPASWIQAAKSTNGDSSATNGSIHSHSEPSNFALFLEGKSVRTVYGPVALQHALAWPVFGSYDELAGCAKWMNGRIPNVDEVRSIYSQVDAAKKKQAEKVQAKLAGVNGHLSNDGVQESPPSAPALDGSSSVTNCPAPQDHFVNLEEWANVGFSNFHPTPVTHMGKKLCGRGELGGVWEWTSSTLEEHDGFVAMDEYPGYTADFFDGKHNM